MKTLEAFFLGFFAVIALFIVFVKAGSTGTSGGAQTGVILQSAGNALSNVASSLEGNL